MAERLPSLADLSPEQRALFALRFKNRRSASAEKQRIPRRAGMSVYPLSFEQEQLWFLHQIGIESGVHHLNHSLRLRGPLDRLALGRSVDEIVRRHEILRTSFFLRDDAPAQAVTPFRPGALAFLDLSDLPEAERDERAQRLAAEQGSRPFDLAQGPMTRTTLLRLSPDEHLLLLTLHHIVTDWVSFKIFAGELSLLYQAFAEGRATPLPELPIQFGDFAAWQREWLQGETLDKLLSYWKQQLAGVPPLLKLPTDRPRPAVQTYRGHRHFFLLPRELFAAFQELSRRAEVTAFTALLGVFQTLLYRYTGQEDVLISTPIAMRHRAETEGLIGFLLNALLLRASFAGEPSYMELLARLRPVIVGAYAHQDLPFPRLVQELRPERDLSYTPLFQVNFVYLTAQAPIPEALGENQTGLTLAGLDVGASEVQRHVTSEFDLTLVLEEKPEGLLGFFRYNVDLFDLTTVERMTGHLRRLMESIAADPHRPVSKLSLLTDEELRRLLVEPNQTALEYRRDLLVHELFAEQATQTPSAVAAVCEGEQLSYAELNERANRLAHHLRALGVGPEARVGLLTEHSLDTLVGLLGILKAGAAYVGLDTDSPPARLAFIFQDVGMAALVTQRHLLARLPPGSARAVCLDADWPAIEEQPAHDPSGTVSGENLAQVLYTSGSTGKPKGVATEHRQLLHYAEAIRGPLALIPRASFALQQPLSVDASLTFVWTSLLSGGVLHVITRERATDAAALSSYFRAWRPDYFKVAPSYLAALQAAARVEEFMPKRMLMLGGESSSAEWAGQLRRAAPECLVLNQYGPTETTCGVLVYAATAEAVAPQTATLPIGRPLPNCRAYVLDAHLNPVPAGVAGELYVGGDGLARGYLNRPGLTAERFVPDPFSTEGGARLYRTGDSAKHLPDGNVEFLGRADQQVKIRGFRVELGEVEAALGKHPAVQSAVVLDHEDANGRKMLVAYATARAGTQPTGAELREHLRAELPDYMVPTVITLLAELPHTAHGKVDRRALPAPERGAPGDAYLAPSTATERRLAEIWAAVLKLERVSAAANFFDLGGHSLLAIQLIARVREVFHAELRLRSLFEAPTLAGMAALVDEKLRAGRDGDPPPLVPVERAGALPLSFAQRRLWLLHQLAPESSAYNIPTVVEVTGRLDVAALERTLREIVRRHESLRTSFRVIEGEPVQMFADDPPVGLPVIDLAGLPAAERAETRQRLCFEEAQRPFDLTRAPLLRACILRLADEEHLLLFTVHHIVSDGSSTDVLVREVAALYEAFTQGRPSPLAPLPVQYADYAVWQRGWLQGEVLDEQLAYWRGQLADVSALDLPTDRPAPAAPTFRGASLSAVVPDDLAAQLRELSRREGVTMFMTLLAAFQILLARYTGQTDIVVGTPIANRDRVELESLIGFFVNTLALRTDLSGDPSFRELLGRVRAVALDAYARQDVPFDLVVEELQPKRGPKHSPLFQTMLSVQSSPHETLTLPGLTLRLPGAPSETAKFDLMLNAQETARGLVLRFEYSTDLFDASTVARLMGHYQTLLAGAAARPDTRLADLPLLTPAERHRQLVVWNDTRREYADDSCVHELFERQAARTPDAPALVCEAARLSYGELNERANRLAHYLRGVGVGPEVLVGVLMERSVEMVVALLGILKAGGAYVPLDPAYPDERLRFMLADAGLSLILTQAGAAGVLRESSARVVCLDDEWETVAREGAENPARAASAHNLAYVIYTSGSTGRPKGAMLPHRGVVNSIHWMQEKHRLDASDSFLLKTSLNFDPSVWEVFWTLSAGACLHVARPGGHSDGAYLAGYIAEHGITSIIFVPAMLRTFLGEPGVAACTSLRRVKCIGEALPPETIRRFFAVLPHAELHNSYGPTETSIASSEWTCEPEGARRQVSIGYPLANTQLYVLDGAMQPVPVGVAGELYIGGAGLGRGYLGRPGLTAERFVPDPFSVEAGARLYRTGDVARYAADGSLEFVGRADRQVKVRGSRVELGEVESALARHPAVKACAVAALADGGGGDGAGLRLAGYFVATGETAPAVDELRRHLLRQLPEYMVPTAWLALEALPLTPNGKVDYKALPEPTASRPQLTAPYLAPATEAERALTKIWQHVLQVEQIGVEDNFFDLGGHSLHVLKVHGEVARTFGRELPVVELFQYQTIGTLAAHLSREEGAPAPPPPGEARPEVHN